MKDLYAAITLIVLIPTLLLTISCGRKKKKYRLQLTSYCDQYTGYCEDSDIRTGQPVSCYYKNPYTGEKTYVQCRR